LKTPLYRVEFSNRRAVVKSWQLKNYTDDSKPQKTLDLVHPQAATEIGGWPFALVFDDPQLGNFGQFRTLQNFQRCQFPASAGGPYLHLERRPPAGHQEIHFDHSYTVNVETT